MSLAAAVRDNVRDDAEKGIVIGTEYEPEKAKAGDFFHGFADAFDTFYDGKRSPNMQRIDRRFRNDMFARYALTFARKSASALGVRFAASSS